MSRLHRARPDYFCEAHGKRESDVSFFSICIQHSYFWCSFDKSLLRYRGVDWGAAFATLFGWGLLRFDTSLFM